MTVHIGEYEFRLSRSDRHVDLREFAAVSVDVACNVGEAVLSGEVFIGAVGEKSRRGIRNLYLAVFRCGHNAEAHFVTVGVSRLEVFDKRAVFERFEVLCRCFGSGGYSLEYADAALVPVAGSPPSQVNVKKSVEVVLKVGTYLRRSRFFSEMLCPSATSRPESLRTPFFGDGREVIVIYSNPPLPPTAFLKSSDVKDMSQFITPHFLISSLFFIITRPGERL